MAFSLFSLMLKPGQAGTAVWGRGELFPLGVFYAAACLGDWGNGFMPCGEDGRGHLRSPPIATLKQFSLLPVWSGGYPTRKGGVP